MKKHNAHVLLKDVVAVDWIDAARAVSATKAPAFLSRFVDVTLMRRDEPGNVARETKVMRILAERSNREHFDLLHSVGPYVSYMLLASGNTEALGHLVAARGNPKDKAGMLMAIVSAYENSEDSKIRSKLKPLITQALTAKDKGHASDLKKKFFLRPNGRLSLNQYFERVRDCGGPLSAAFAVEQAA